MMQICNRQIWQLHRDQRGMHDWSHQHRRKPRVLPTQVWCIYVWMCLKQYHFLVPFNLHNVHSDGMDLWPLFHHQAIGCMRCSLFYVLFSLFLWSEIWVSSFEMISDNGYHPYLTVWDRWHLVLACKICQMIFVRHPATNWAMQNE